MKTLSNVIEMMSIIVKIIFVINLGNISTCVDHCSFPEVTPTKFNPHIILTKHERTFITNCNINITLFVKLKYFKHM